MNMKSLLSPCIFFYYWKGHYINTVLSSSIINIRQRLAARICTIVWLHTGKGQTLIYLWISIPAGAPRAEDAKWRY